MKTKHLLLSLIFCLINSLVGLSQNIDSEFIISDTNTVSRNDTIENIIDSLFRSEQVLPDSLLEYQSKFSKEKSIFESDSMPQPIKKKKNTNFISSKVEYNAEDSTIYSIDGQKVYLFGQAEINYEDINLKAGYIEVDMKDGYLYAEGLKDSLGNEYESPIFLQDGQEIKSKSITYNLKTQKGYIKGLYTEQEDGYLHSSQTKKEADNTINLNRGKYTTCELEDPHFYLWISRGKVVPNKAIVSSYAFLVIADVPLYPLMIPFGFFPNTKEKASGFIIPTFGEETNRGFYLRDGGYYFALSDYADLAIKGDIYSKGSWQIGATSKYRQRYKFSGNVNLGYSKVIANEPSLDEDGEVYQVESNQYRVVWSHAQDAKARPNSNFSASVNFTSMDDNRYNSTNLEDQLTNTTTSSIAYRRSFANTPFNFTANLSHSQNTQTEIVSLTLPQITFTMSRIFPFRSKESKGEVKWYENIGVSYTGSYKNSTSDLQDSVMFTSAMWDAFSHGAKHYVPISTSLKVLKYFNLSPTITFNDYMYFKRDVRVYDEDSIDNPTYETVTESGFYNLYDYSFSASLGTTLYGMYQYKGKWLKAIRHVATPSVSFSYRPDFSNDQFGFYISDTNESTGYYNPYTEHATYGYPSTGKSGAISFSLNNNVEMKVANKRDTTEANATKKIKLLESMNFSSSYNLIADSMNWAPIAISARTTLFKGLSINMSAAANLYGLNSSGTAINEFEKDMTGNLFRLTALRASTGYTFNSKNFTGSQGDDDRESDHDDGHHHDYIDGYDYFDIPWDLTVSYAYSYSKTGLTPSVSQTLNFSGGFSLTPKWKIGFRSGWDFEDNDFASTSFNLSRDLHCWMATLNVVPFGQYQSYSFSIGVKSSILQDLKYDKNESWTDQYAY